MTLFFGGALSAAPRWADPEVFEINRLPAHAFSLVFPNEESAAREPDWADPYAGSSRFQSLNGNWSFQWSENLSQAPAGFEQPEFSVGDWDRIQVPLPWQVAGYGQLYYFNAYHPYYGDPRNPDAPLAEDGGKRRGENQKRMAEESWIPTVFNPVGCYRRTFCIPEDWSGQEVILHFGGVQSAFTCWVNGREVGYSEDSYTPAEFDITPYLSPGSNTLAVRVIRWSDGAYMENQDMIRMSGIIRDVMLVARPPQCIEDFHLVPTLDRSLKRGVLRTRISLLNRAATASGKGEVALTLLNPDGKKVLHTSIQTAPVEPGRPAQITLPDVTLDRPALWHPETPHLYTALLTLSENGQVKEVIRQDVAFRRFDWDDLGNLHLNGKRFYMRGVNRHDTSPETGRTVSYAEMLEDVRRMKQLNVNTVRNSHYPRDPRWYALCARYGIAVIDECNLETHGNEAILSDDHPEWRAQALFRIRNMVMRNRNEPAILVWSLGNEQFREWPQTVRDQAKLLRELDPTRGIMAERAWDYRKDIIHGEGLIDFVAPMYGGIGRAAAYLRHGAQGDHRPFVYCEYAHCMGNSMAELADKWAFQEQNSGLNGGCIWDWVDQALLRPLKGYPGLHWTYGGDWGDFASDDIFCANGILLPDRSIQTAKPLEVKTVYQQAAFADGDAPGRVRITNKYATFNLNRFDLDWTLLRNGAPVQTGTLRPDVPPLSSAEISVPCTRPEGRPGDRFELNLDLKLHDPEPWAAAGYCVAQGQVSLPPAAGDPPAFGLPPGHLAVKQSSGAVSVSGGDFEIVFDRRAGTLGRYRLNGEELLAPDAALGGIELNPYSAPTDDRRVWPVPAQRKAYAKGYDRLLRTNVEMRVIQEKADRVVVETTADYLASGGEGLRHQAFYTVFADGTVEADNRVRKIDLPDTFFLIRLGVRIPVDSRLGSAEYLGLGPLANYSDRSAGARIGEFSLDAKAFYENYLHPQECGNREEVEWIALRNQESGNGLLVTSNDRFSSSVMPWTAEQMSGVKHRVELPESGRNILRIDARMSGIAKNGNVNFAGDAAFAYSIRPLRPGNHPAAVARPRMAKELAHPIPLTGRPVLRHPLPKGWINASSHATVTYSSTSRFARYGDTLLTTQEFPFAFHTEAEKEPWLLIDLGKTQPVVGIRIQNRSDAQGNRTRNLHVWLSEDGEIWKQVFEATDPQFRWDIRLSSSEPARYVKIGLINPEPVFFHLKGVDVFRASPDKLKTEGMEK